jgi:hypothetical protein
MVRNPGGFDAATRLLFASGAAIGSYLGGGRCCARERAGYFRDMAADNVREASCTNCGREVWQGGDTDWQKDDVLTQSRPEHTDDHTPADDMCGRSRR